MGIPYAEVIGDPIAHSKSPLIHKFWLGKLGRSGDYRACRVTGAELGTYVHARRRDPVWRGCNVTMPLKLAVLDHVDEPSGEARRLGAVNCIVPKGGRLLGTNFDADAVLHSLIRFPWTGRAVIVGSGGAARAALWAAGLLGFDELVVMSRDRGKASRMVEQLGIQAAIEPLGGAPECTLLVNATPMGMTGRPSLPLILDRMAGDGAVMDMVYDPLATSLLRSARHRGLRIFDGLTVLIEQAAMSFATFFDRGISEQQRIEARQVLTA